MDLCTWLIVGAGVATGLYAIFLAKDATPPPMQDGWFGRGPPRQDEDESIRPFKIRVTDDVISDLKTRLSKTRFSEDLENTQFQFGFQSTYLKEVVQYWQTQYDWRKHEAVLNQFPQFKTTIEGIEVHFLRVKPATPTGRTVMISHGWPGSVWEFYKLIPRLTDPAKYGGRDEDAFEVICPSIPGFGFSETPHQQGFDSTDAARVFHKLMTQRLGYEKYYIHGGDWGHFIATIMAQAYPVEVLGIHLTMYFPSTKSLTSLIKQVVVRFFPSLFLHPEDQKLLTSASTLFKEWLMETGYLHLQTTKPDTAAAGLNDSPAGLAAYILEKFSTGTCLKNRDLPDGGLTRKFTLDELLTNVMIYWVQGNIGPSMRLYKESMVLSEEVNEFDPVPVDVPTGLAALPEELIFLPETFVNGKYRNILQFTRMPRGGHFPALEETELLVNDVISFVRKTENRQTG